MTGHPSGETIAAARSVDDLRKQVCAWRARGERIALVPTMGALHEGHLSLVRFARARADRVIASIFVNPAQFAPHEDFDSYPRKEAADLEKLESERTDLAFIPPREEMYPEGFATRVVVSGLGEPLCGASRPHFFGGVATVVAKLLNQAQPDIAVFGEKDYQQLIIIKRLARDLDVPVEIIGAPTIREADGLAMSSRNAYLNPEQRKIAPRLYAVLREAAEKLSGGAPVADARKSAHAALEDAGFDRVDYFDIRRAEDLAEIGPGPLSVPARVFGAVFLGDARLIDNLPVPRTPTSPAGSRPADQG
ncbi:MAG: pantoate--beta-alanine ligase [Parvularculaceae bacterium]